MSLLITLPSGSKIRGNFHAMYAMHACYVSLSLNMACPFDNHPVDVVAQIVHTLYTLIVRKL